MLVAFADDRGGQVLSDDVGGGDGVRDSLINTVRQLPAALRGTLTAVGSGRGDVRSAATAPSAPGSARRRGDDVDRPEQLVS